MSLVERCPRAEDLPILLDPTPDGEAAAGLRRHTGECPQCQSELLQLQEGFAALGPPPGWRESDKDTLAQQRIAAAVVPEILAALAGPLVYRVDPDALDFAGAVAPPGAGHPLGTDELGRDVLLRLLQGGRISLAVGVSGALLAAAIGTLVGLVAGYAGGGVDAFLMRCTDAVISLPLLPLLIVLAAVDLGKLGLAPSGEAVSVLRIVLIVALFGWTTPDRKSVV